MAWQVYYLTVLKVSSPGQSLGPRSLGAGRAVATFHQLYGKSVYWLTQVLADFSSLCCMTDILVSSLYLSSGLCIWAPQSSNI